MAHKEIPEITAADALDGLEQLHCVQGSNSRRVTVQEIVDFAMDQLQNLESFILPLSDETTALVVAAAKFTFRAPYEFTLTSVKADVNTAPVGSNIVVDINVAGASVLSTPITIDDGEETSSTAAVPPVIIPGSAIIPANAEISVDIDGVGSGTAGAGLKVTLVGRQT